MPVEPRAHGVRRTLIKGLTSGYSHHFIFEMFISNIDFPVLRKMPTDKPADTDDSLDDGVRTPARGAALDRIIRLASLAGII